MSGAAHIDSLKFARERKRLEGGLDVATLPRLHDLLFDQSGRVCYVVSGTVDHRGRPALDVRVDGELNLVCQRCLGSLQHRFTRSTRLVVYGPDETLPDVGAEEPDSEAVHADSISDIGDVVEQEAILALPISAVHVDEECLGGVSRTTPARRESPFAVLRNLKT